MKTAFAIILILMTAWQTLGQGEGAILQRVQERGKLICGVNALLPGFGAQNDAGDFVGFDTDICRAVAAAILGDANAIIFRPLNSAERPTALASGEVDMISRNTTWTLSRDTEWGATFAPTTFYDGQGIMLKHDFGVDSLDETGRRKHRCLHQRRQHHRAEHHRSDRQPRCRLDSEYLHGC